MQIRPCETGRPAEAGFTLTELLVVLAIIALLVASAPALLNSALPQMRTMAAARTLASEMRAARGTAIAEGVRVSVRFDPRKQTYVVEGGKEQSLPQKVRFTLPSRGAAAKGEIQFFSDGSSTGGVVVVGEGMQQHRVVTDWLTGRITVDE